MGSVPMKLPSMRLPTVSPCMSMPVAEAVDDEALDHAAVRRVVDLEPACRVRLVPASSILSDGVVAYGLGVGGGPGLGVAVYGHRIGYGGQVAEAGRWSPRLGLRIAGSRGC